MITYNDLVNELSEITDLATRYATNPKKSLAIKLFEKIEQINIMLDKLFEKETEEANEREEQAN